MKMIKGYISFAERILELSKDNELSAAEILENLVKERREDNEYSN